MTRHHFYLSLFQRLLPLMTRMNSHSYLIYRTFLSTRRKLGTIWVVLMEVWVFVRIDIDS